MPLFLDNKQNIVLFIHIPKTGGTSIKHILIKNSQYIGYTPTRGEFPASIQHFNASLLVKIGYKDISKYSFAVVRNPLDRIISEYKYRKKQSLVVRKFMNIDLFVHVVFELYKFNQYVLDNHIRPQKEFILKDTNTYKIEDGLENIKELEWLKLDELIGGVEQHNKSESEVIQLNSSTLRLIVEFYDIDYDYFSYKKPKIGEISAIESVVYKIASLTVYWLYRIINKIIK